MDDHEIGKMISILARKMFARASKELVEYDICGGQIPFLRVIHLNEGLSQEELSSELGVDKATTAKAVKKLVVQGYVEKERDLKDKRRYQLKLTDKARQEIPHFKQVFQATGRELTRDFSTEEKHTMMDLLKRASVNLERAPFPEKGKDGRK